MVTTTQTNEGLENHIAFNSMREDLENKYPNEWIVIHAQDLIGHYKTYETARAGAKDQKLDLARCMFQKLNATPTIILSYGD